MSELLADSAVQPVSIYAGAHYLTIVKDEHVKVAQYQLISGFISVSCIIHSGPKIWIRHWPTLLALMAEL